jgi:predicted TIM-barrel fold metal-dependent hydrolase
MPHQIIDCDVHNTYRSQVELYPYLEEPWLTRLKEKGLGYPLITYFSSVDIKRLDSKPEIGTSGSDYTLLREQLLDRHKIRYALLTGEGILGLSLMPDAAYPAALARAYNQWLADKWLSLDARFLGSLHLAIQDPEAAAAEIYRWADHPQIVQVSIPATTQLPLSHPFYRPVLRAAAETGMLIGLHFRQVGPTVPAITPIGAPSNYLDYHGLVSLPYMSQMVMLITSGVLEELPALKFLMMEGGFIWAIHLMWRLDKDYRAVYRLAPGMKKLPSEYVRQHFKFGLQPVYEAPQAGQLWDVVEAGGLQHNLVYSSDYPHWDSDEPDFINRFVPEEWRKAIFEENAAAWLRPKIVLEHV